MIFTSKSKAFAEGAIIGGVSGGLLTTLSPVLSSAGAVGKGLLTAAATGVGDLVAQKLVNGNVDIKRNLLVAGTAGLLTGGASLLSDKLAPKISQGISKGVSKVKSIFTSSADDVANTTVNSGKRLEPNLQLFGHTADDVVGKGAGGADDVSNLYRKVKNTGELKDLEELMQLKNVKKIAKDAGVGLDDISIKIDRNPELIGSGYCGYTSPNGKSITLYPDAFTNTETLVKTLGHERMHIYQVKTFGVVQDAEMAKLFEKGAWGSENDWWNYFNNSGGIK